MIKSADTGSVVVVSDKEGHIKEAEKQLGDEEVYEEFSNDAASSKVRKRLSPL